MLGSEIMDSLTPASLVNSIRQEARPLLGMAEDYNPLLDLIGDSPIVLLGEASYGTHESYRARADITRRLIGKGFNAVAVEADWPHAYRVNRYVQGVNDDTTSVEALADPKKKIPLSQVKERWWLAFLLVATAVSSKGGE
jgi:erythromycin esterase-like protein